MKIDIQGNPHYISQLCNVLAWIENCKHRNLISEFKVRVDNTDSSMDIQFVFDNPELQKQHKEKLQEFSKYNTTKINPIYYIGYKF